MLNNARHVYEGDENPLLLSLFYFIFFSVLLLSLGALCVNVYSEIVITTYYHPQLEILA